MDRSIGEIPEAFGTGLVVVTASCVAVGTRSEQDGTTRITLTDDLEQVGDGEAVFAGQVLTPALRLSVCSVYDEVIIETVVTEPITRVRIWANDPIEPTEIHLVAGG